MRQRELLVEGLTHFFLFVNEAKRTSFERLTDFFYLSTRQRALLVEVGGRWENVNEAKRTVC